MGKMWEYKIINDCEDGNPDSEEDLNALGDIGWELVAIKQEPDSSRNWYFKREAGVR